MTSPYACADIYLSLRSQILQLAQQDPRGVPHDAQGMIAFVMETGYPNAVASLVAVADGTTSLYFSNGGGILGTGAHQAVGSLACQVVGFAGQFVPAMQPAPQWPLPGPNLVRFYLVTTSGTFTAPDAVQEELGAGQHPLSQMFYAGHQLLTAVREHSQPQP